MTRYTSVYPKRGLMRQHTPGGAEWAAKHVQDLVGNNPLPPLYRLTHVELSLEGALRHIRPAFPIAVIPSHGSDIDFKFWGSDNYDVHEAFPMETANKRIRAIRYQIIYLSKEYSFHHDFNANVIMSLNGLHGNKVIMKPFRRLDDMPDLQSDWHYFQFVG